MEIVFYLIIFLFGLSVGSFLNCVIYRLQTGESFLRGRSFCPHCKHILSWGDLIPLLSFILLKGKCRYCQKKISYQYPLVEIATGFLFILVTHYSLPTLNYQSLLFTVYCLLSIFFLAVIFVYDLKHYIIPNKVVYPAILIAFLYRLFETYNLEFVSSFKPLICAILPAIFASGFFLTIVLVSRGRWMGLGDIKLAFFMGLFLGYPNILVALFLAFLIGAIMGVGLILAKKKTLKSEVPFGPFLVIGTFIALFWGQAIIYWYLSLFSLRI